MYTKSEVEKVAIEYFKDSITANVWIDKYALRKGDEFLELHPNDTNKRMAKELARIERNYPNPISEEIIYEFMKDFNKFVLGGSPLFGIGNNVLSSLGNCFVVESPLDSWSGIMKTGQELSQLMKRRGGVGTDLSTLRPNKSKVQNAATNSTGVVPFARLYSEITRTVAQDGRRGALMLSLDIKHPDSPEFISCKDDINKITGANISIRISNEFMKAVEKDEMFTLRFWSNEVKIEREVSALNLWNKLIHQAWKNGEPGIIFWDKVLSESPADCYTGFETISTNPCGELPLCSYDSCRLAAINLYAYVVNPFTNDSGFDLPTLKKDVLIYQRLMDDLIDLEEEKIKLIINKIINDPEPDSVKKIELDLWNNIHNKLLLGRRTGLGQMGLADAMAALGLKYGEDSSLHLTFEINKIISLSSYESSIIMAKERGAFPLWNPILEMNNPYL
jgi:ribonucleoside-diphosphate reductase alpha chain